MAITLNDNLQINAGKPVDTRYLTTGNTVYTSTGATNAAIPIPLRYTGLTVNVMGTEFWYKNGVQNINLIEKKYSTIAPNSAFVTGATNLGFFTGFTGVQVLPLNHLTLPATYSGNYVSIYNNYYRGRDGIIHTGPASIDNIARRGYVRQPIISSPVYKSFIWNEYTGSSNQIGWILIDGNVSLLIGQFVNGVTYYPPATPYANNTWTTGLPYNNASNITISIVIGSLNTGTTITVGAPVWAFKDHNNLHFRTLQTQTPNLIGVSYDESFIYVSGTTGNVLITANNGLTKVGTTVKLGGTLTGTTTIIDGRTASGRTGIEYGADYSITYSDRSLVDRGYVKSVISASTSSGQRVTKTICQVGHGFNVQNVIGWSGGTYNKAIANGLYDGEVIGLVTKCYNANCFDVTQAGYVTGLTGLATNATYFLSDVTAGLLTSTQPVINGHIVKTTLIADSAVSGWVLPYAGYIISNGTGGSLVKNVCMLTGCTTYQMLSSDFYVGACCGSLVILPITPPKGMVTIVADISCLASGNPITIAGPLSNGQIQSQINSDSGSLSYIFNGSKWSVFAFIDTPVPI